MPNSLLCPLLVAVQVREKELALRQAKQAQSALKEAKDLLPNLRFQVCVGTRYTCAEIADLARATRRDCTHCASNVQGLQTLRGQCAETADLACAMCMLSCLWAHFLCL